MGRERSTTNLFMTSFLSRTIVFFFFFLSLRIYLWLAETSQQPISQTTWLKVTPHCHHCRERMFCVLHAPRDGCRSTQHSTWSIKRGGDFDWDQVAGRQRPVHRQAYCSDGSLQHLSREILIAGLE